MKKLNFLLLGILTTLFTYSQEYCPFADSNAIWNEFSIHIEYTGHVAYKTRYGTIGDTIINNKKYSKIYSLFNDTCLNISSGVYFGAIREENKKVYTITTYHGEQEILLYDFSKEIGDTIFSNSPEGYMAYPVIISSIDTIELYDGSKRKRYWLEGGYYSLLSECWIEGLGSIHGLFAPVNSIVLNYYEPNLSCFKQNGSTIYLNNFSCDKCFCFLGTSIKKINENQIRIYPNPFTDKINIESKNEYSEIRIYNSNGKIIRSFSKISYPIRIDLGDIPIGLYFVQMICKDSNYTEKLIKKR